MDLLKNSKKIVPFAMIGLMLTNSIAPAFAHGDHNADISSFQNAQSVTITQQVERNKEVEPSPVNEEETRIENAEGPQNEENITETRTS